MHLRLVCSDMHSRLVRNPTNPNPTQQQSAHLPRQCLHRLHWLHRWVDGRWEVVLVQDGPCDVQAQLHLQQTAHAGFGVSGARFGQGFFTHPGPLLQLDAGVGRARKVFCNTLQARRCLVPTPHTLLSMSLSTAMLR
jgi:DNA-binding transcriptional LysR family regulator